MGDRQRQTGHDDSTPGGNFDAVIVGGGVHGLAAAHYLARNHGTRNVAVLDPVPSLRFDIKAANELVGDFSDPASTT